MKEVIQAFIVEFECTEDLDHYIKEASAHVSFVQSIDGATEKSESCGFHSGFFFFLVFFFCV